MAKAAFLGEAGMLRTLAHPERLAILENLRHGPACVCHLTTALGRSQAYISQQLAILKDAGLIEGRKDGAYVYYHLRDYGVLGVVDLAGRLLGKPAPSAPVAPAPLRDCECPRCRLDAAPKPGD